MGLLDRFSRRRGDKAASVAAADAVETHLDDFIDSHSGVEAYVEQPTATAGPSLLLVAADGEWTRRSVASVSWGRSFARRHGIPCYEAAVVGYPQRMRDFNKRKKLRPNEG